jgi:hypothetical protein
MGAFYFNPAGSAQAKGRAAFHQEGAYTALQKTPQDPLLHSGPFLIGSNSIPKNETNRMTFWSGEDWACHFAAASKEGRRRTG